MTLREFFDLLAENPFIILFYFIALPLTAFLAWQFGKGEGDKSPWKFLYSGLVYMATIPGIFAITLSLYLFLFERRSILDTDMYTQIIPVISMIGTLWLVRQNICFEDIPGFHRLSGLVMIITALLAFGWFIDRMHIIAITFIPFYYVIIGFVILLILIRFGWSMMYGNDSQSQSQ